MALLSTRIIPRSRREAHDSSPHLSSSLFHTPTVASSYSVFLSRDYRVAGVVICSKSCTGENSERQGCSCMLVNDKRQGLAYRKGTLIEHGPWTKRLDTLRKVHVKTQADLAKYTTERVLRERRANYEHCGRIEENVDMRDLSVVGDLARTRREVKHAEERLDEFLAYLKAYDVKVEKDVDSVLVVLVNE